MPSGEVGLSRARLVLASELAGGEDEDGCVGGDEACGGGVEGASGAKDAEGAAGSADVGVARKVVGEEEKERDRQGDEDGDKRDGRAQRRQGQNECHDEPRREKDTNAGVELICRDSTPDTEPWDEDYGEADPEAAVLCKAKGVSDRQSQQTRHWR